MRAFTLIFFVSLLNAQVTVQDLATGSTINSLTITPISSNQAGTMVSIQGTVNGEHIYQTTTLNSAVNTFYTSGGQKIAIFLQRPYPNPISSGTTFKPVQQYAAELSGAAMDRIKAQTYINRETDAQEAQRLGFSSVAKYKSFTSQNRTKIAQARKNGSTDPVGDVLDEANAKKDSR